MIRDTLMNPALWRSVPYFTQTEKWGDPYRVRYGLIVELVKLRKLLGRPILIHCGFREGDPGSHGAGEAVDCHADGMSVVEFYLAASRFRFGGIGVYPWWNNPGLHLDVRKVERRAQWGCIWPRQYVTLNEQFLKEAMA